MRGSNPGRGEGWDGERKLAAATLLQAVADAQRGDSEAAQWLEDGGGIWAEYLQLPARVLRCWPEALSLASRRPNRAAMTEKQREWSLQERALRRKLAYRNRTR
jgi:hypothetical protein